MTNRKGKAARKSVSHPGMTRGSTAAARARRAVQSVERDTARRKGQAAKELGRIQVQYRRELARLLGVEGVRELDAIPRARSSRPQRIKRSLAVLGKTGVDRARIHELRLPYLKRAREILEGIGSVAPPSLPHHAPCSNPWVTYHAPFAGYSWSWVWERTSGSPNPVLDRYLDAQTGLIGSKVEIEDTDASNYDYVSADYYTGLNVWHTPLSTGPLEVYLSFEFDTSTYMGDIEDEWGFSDITYTQYAAARLLAADAFDPIQRETASSPIYGFTDAIWGDDHSWSKQVAATHDRHWYFFRTAATFQQGSSVMLEAGIMQGAWFETNDESVSMSADLNLRLDAIIVRSCDAPIIL